METENAVIILGLDNVQKTITTCWKTVKKHVITATLIKLGMVKDFRINSNLDKMFS
jgi:hypothetical protein